MPLHVEQVADNLIAHLQANYSAALTNVLTETDPNLALNPPATADYYIGEPSRFRAFQKPAVFVVTNRTNRPLAATNEDYNTLLYQEHRLIVDLVVEGTDEQELTRACWRHAQALDVMLNEVDLIPAAITAYSTKTFVTDIDYGVLFTLEHPEQRIFGKDVQVDVLVKHWDQRTELPVQLGSGTQITSVVGAAATGGVVASASETLLTSTSATNIVQYTPPTAGNYAVALYYRVVTAATTLTLTVTWTDATGAQTATAAAGTQSIGSYSVNHIFVNSVAGLPVTVTATAGTANQVYVSATIEVLT